jgi:hypothetical protein
MRGLACITSARGSQALARDRNQLVLSMRNLAFAWITWAPRLGVELLTQRSFELLEFGADQWL